MSAPIFGSLKYMEVARLTKRLKKSKTADDIKMLQRQIDFLQMEIKKEENEGEVFFEKI
jgi:hypothetical protein